MEIVKNFESVENGNLTRRGNYTEDIGDIHDYLAAVLGPARLPLIWLIPLTLVYAIIFISGMVGNICTCIVITKESLLKTSTNCYLFNLSIADMLTLIYGMPLELYSLWQQYPWQLGTLTCILRSVVSEASAYASILTIMKFSCDHYYAVCHPLHHKTQSKIKRAFRNIAIIWLISFMAAAPYGYFTKVNYIILEDDEELMESAWCGFPFNDPNKHWETLMLCSTVLFFVVPMVLMTVLYSRISITLYRARNQFGIETAGEDRNDGHRARIRSRMAVIKMLLTVVVAFFICWAPYHSQRLLFLYVSLYGEWTDTLRKINHDLFTLAGCFYYFNSTINPVLYTVMSNRFRVAFREKLCADNPCTRASCFCCCCWKRWRDCQTYRNGRSVSSSSQREDPVIVPQLQASLKEKSPALGRCIGISLSEENLKSIEKDRPHFNSDPNLFPEACC